MLALNYSGVVTDNFFLEAQYSQKEYTFLGGGSRFIDDPAQGGYDGTLLQDRQRESRRFWSPTFRYQEEGESRDHELYTINGSYFLSTGGLGTHELKAGYEHFDELRRVNNYQNGSDYRVYAYTTIIRGDEIYPRCVRVAPPPASTGCPSSSTVRAPTTSVDSVYLNDRWVLNEHWTFNLGVRYDKNDAVSGDGSVPDRTTPTSEPALRRELRRLRRRQAEAHRQLRPVRRAPRRGRRQRRRPGRPQRLLLLELRRAARQRRPDGPDHRS